MDDIQAIERLKARYCRYVDTKDWDGLRREVLADDVHVDVSADSDQTHDGADAFLAMLAPALDGVVSVHHVHMPEIDLTSPTTATGTWAMEDVLQFPPESGLGELHGWGHYHETYVRADAGWRIQSMRLTRLRRDVTTPDGDPVAR